MTKEKKNRIWESPQTLWESPQTFRESPQTLRESPQTFRESPQTFRESPQTFRESPQTFREFLQTLRELPRTALVTLSVSIFSISLSAQNCEINKKEADASLTDSLRSFECRNAALTDSIYNSILGEYAQNNLIELSILHRRYGALPPAVEMTLRDLICMFIDDFNIYFSVEESAGETVSITTVFSHKTYSYIHMLVAKTAKQEFIQRKRPVKADFYSFIPQKLIKQ